MSIEKIEPAVADEESLDMDFEFDSGEKAEKAPQPITLAEKPLFSALLQRTAEQIWPDDAVVHDFVEFVATPLSENFAHVTAKGGDFVRQQLQSGKAEAEVERYKNDQSMRAHLINGLFPVLHIAKQLQAWGAPQFRYYDDMARRVFLAGYVLHDYVKLPDVKVQLEAAGLTHDSLNPAKHRPLVEEILRTCCTQLGLDRFLEKVGGVELLLHDLIYVVSNTQKRWGTLRNLSALPKLYLPSVQRDLCEQLSRMADYVAYAAGTTPGEVAAHPGLRSELATLSNQMAELAYHHIADVRGVITNLIQNAALDAWRSEDCVPILYAPSGVIYLARRGAIHLPERTAIAEDVVRRVKQISSRQLSNNLTGFGRDGKGMKHADYYHLFFNRLDLLAVGFNATFKIIREGKTPSAGKRFAKLAVWMETGIEPQTVDDVRVDQLAEWCYLAEKTAANLPGGGELTARILLEALDLRDLYEDFMEVPRDNRAGGVGYHWYFAAGHFFLKNRHLDPLQWRERVAELARDLVEHLRNTEATQPTPVSKTDGFDDLRRYVASVLSFGAVSLVNEASTNHFAAELARYTNAKKARGRTPICSLCSSAYTVNKQQESAILFAPQVYSNKLQLHGNDAIRDICSICGTEIMLRQLLMNETNFKGKDFEGRNLRYLYFYPSYFFTPETLAIFKIVHDQLRNISFTDLRRQLIDDKGERPELRFEAKVWQHLEPLLMTPEPPTPGQDRFLRMHFPEGEPITFYFLGIPPPGRDAKDAESWVNPAFLSLLLPLCLDVKVVVSAASMPLLNEANELPETVFLDGAHAAIGYIVGEERINLDRVLPMLKRLATTYLIHLDGNSGMGSKGFDYRWQDLPALARSLHESPLFVFHYLKKWQRKAGMDGIPESKASLYLQFYQRLTYGGDDDMTRAEELTTKYRRFYRARSHKTHAIVRPLSIAAEALLTADKGFWDDQTALTQVVHGRLHTRIRQLFREKLAYPPQGSTIEEQDAAMADFARYFVAEVYDKAFRRNLAALGGKQLNLIKNACEVLYRTSEAQYWRERKAAGVVIEEEPFDDSLEK